MTTTPTSGAAIQRYKIGYHADEWGQRSSTPSGIPDASGSWVRYADHVTALAAGQATAAPAEPDPTPGDHPQPCDSELFESGVSVGLFDIPQWTAEALCKGIAAATGARVDWHYIGGRVHVKALPAPTSAEGVAYAALPDERAAFERWNKDANQGYDLAPCTSGKLQTFESTETEHAWRGFFHGLRASRGQAPAGAREAAEHYRNAIARARLLDSDLSNLTERGAKAWAGVDAQGLRDGGASPSANAGGPSAHIKEPYTIAEIKAKIASNDYSAEMLLQHAMLLLDSVQEDAALWHWLAEYLVGTRTDLDDEIVASETVNDLRKLVEAARKQGASHD